MFYLLQAAIKGALRSGLDLCGMQPNQYFYQIQTPEVSCMPDRALYRVQPEHIFQVMALQEVTGSE
jgi:hypothetical protein